MPGFCIDSFSLALSPLRSTLILTRPSSYAKWDESISFLAQLCKDIFLIAPLDSKLFCKDTLYSREGRLDLKFG